MRDERIEISEAVQKLAVQVLATNPAGEGMCLIGGFRYRLLDGSCRSSLDLDYHWPDDLEAKQAEVVALFRRKLLPLVRTRLDGDGRVSPVTGPDAESPAVKTVEIAVWREGGTAGRVTVPVDITRIPCMDKPVVRTVEGVVCLTASDADMAESKVVSIFARSYLQERDIVDLFLFRDGLPDDSAGRVRRKLEQLSLDRDYVAKRLEKMAEDRAYHVRNIGGILKEQVDAPAAANIERAGGAGMVFDAVMDLLRGRLELDGSGKT